MKKLKGSGGDTEREREKEENWPRSLATLATKHVQ